MPPEGGISYFECKLLALLALLGALALLVRDTAAGLASRLAGSLALAAATLLCALAQVAGLNGLDMLHDGITSVKNTVCIIAQIGPFVNMFDKKTYRQEFCRPTSKASTAADAAEDREPLKFP